MTRKHWVLGLAAAAAALGCKPRNDAASGLRADASAPAAASAFAAACGHQDQVGADRVIDQALFTSRTFVKDEDVEDCIYADLTSITDESVAANTRYFTLTHLYNAGVSAEELLFYRGAISKTINSLSTQPRITRPVIVDPLGTIVRVNLADYDWDQPLAGSLGNRFDLVFKFEGSTFDNEDDLTAQQGPNFKVVPPYLYQKQLPKYDNNALTAKVYKNSLRFVYGRGDWFVSRATIPPLYHTLLNMGTDDLSLEQQILGDRSRVELDIQTGKVIRSGFDSSGVSSNNRLLERHEGRFRDAYYWKSYDFGNSVGVGNFKANPFGPCFRTIDPPVPLAPTLSRAALFKTCASLTSDDDFQAKRVFKQGGGEIIFTLPDGLQAYFLINNQGKRLSVGPANIVADLSNPTDKFTVINARSCMFCHNQGMIDGKEDELGPAIRRLTDVTWDPNVNKRELQLFADKAFPAETVQGAVRSKVKRNYDTDRTNYMRAERDAVGPDVYLTTDPPERQAPFRDMLARNRYAEVVNFMNDKYKAIVNRDEAAAEFGLTTADMINRISQGGVGDAQALQFLNKFTRENGNNTMTREQFEALFARLATALAATPSTLGQTPAAPDAVNLTCDNTKLANNSHAETAFLPKKDDGTFLGSLDGNGDAVDSDKCNQLISQANRRGGLVCAPTGTLNFDMFVVATGRRLEAGDAFTFNFDDKDKCMTAIQNITGDQVCGKSGNFHVIRISTGAVVQDMGTDFNACIARAKTP